MGGKYSVKITFGEEGFIIAGNHENNCPYISSNESGIFKSLCGVIKYFFPESFDFNYTGAELSEQTIAGLEAVKEIYELCASYYINITELHKKKLERLVTGLNELVKPQTD